MGRLHRFNECEMQMSYANAMIGLTNTLGNGGISTGDSKPPWISLGYNSV